MTGKRRIIFRADGNSQIGLGHVVRSLALAAMLREEFECVFAIQAPAKELQEQIRQVCDGTIVLPVCTLAEDRFVHELDAYISEEEMVVLDGYDFDTLYQESIKAKGALLVCIDDIHAYPFVADVVINHGAVDSTPYQVAYYTKLLLGPKYALLRQPFLRQPRNNKKRDGLFLCFGGSDVHNLTRRYLEAIAGGESIYHVEVVVGSAYSYFDTLQEFVQQNGAKRQIRLHQNISAAELARIMSRCSIAVVPGSSIALECAAMGLGLICGYYAENQKEMLKVLTEGGVAVDVGNMLELEAHRLIQAIDKVLDNPQAGVAGELLFGGRSPHDNLLNEFRQLHLAAQLQIRRAHLTDVDTYFAWANERLTRANAVNGEEISYSAHVSWFEQRVKSDRSHLYLLSLGGESVAQVRFDMESEGFAIDYSVSAEHRGLGLGRAVMAKAIAQLKKDLKGTTLLLKATVKLSNAASCRVFESLRFQLAGSKYIDGTAYYTFEIRL